MELASVAIVISLRYHPDSIIAQKDLESAFSHSLDPGRTLILLLGDTPERQIALYCTLRGPGAALCRAMKNQNF